MTLVTITCEVCGAERQVEYYRRSYKTCGRKCSASRGGKKSAKARAEKKAREGEAAA